MARIQKLTTTALVWASTFSDALAQQTSPAPPIKETGPAGVNSTASNVAATDFNWVWLSLVIAVVALALYSMARRRQSGNPPRR